MLLWCSVNEQLFSHDKASSTSRFIQGKSGDFQKLLRYLIEIVTSTLMDGIGGCGSCGFGFPGCGVVSGVFPTPFFFHTQMTYYLKHYP